MYSRSAVLGCAFFLLSLCAEAQVNTKETTPQANSEKVATEGMKEEKVEGILAFAEYLGNKLVKELGERMNLDAGDKNRDEIPTKVSIRVGIFRVERIENR